MGNPFNQHFNRNYRLYNSIEIIMAEKTKKYNWMLTARKFGIVTAEILLAGGIAYFMDNSIFLGIVPLLEAFRNFIKHY